LILILANQFIKRSEYNTDVIKNQGKTAAAGNEDGFHCKSIL
jgi:hypothetical protein